MNLNLNFNMIYLLINKKKNYFRETAQPGTGAFKYDLFSCCESCSDCCLACFFPNCYNFIATSAAGN